MSGKRKEKKGSRTEGAPAVKSWLLRYAISRFFRGDVAFMLLHSSNIGVRTASLQINEISEEQAAEFCVRSDFTHKTYWIW